MKHDFDQLALLLGVLLGFAFASLFILSPVFLKNLETYQTLIAGLLAAILALGGAAATVWVVNRQIIHAQEMENERRARRMYAARAMMPHALSSLCEYASNCAHALRAGLDPGTPPETYHRVILPDNVYIPPPPEALAILRDCLEFGEAGIQDRIAELMTHLQIHGARLRNNESLFREDDIGGDWFYTLLIDSVEVHARACMMFAYARKRTEHAPGQPQLDDMISAAQSCNFSNETWPILYDALEMRVTLQT